jgi:hypothetical protein
MKKKKELREEELKHIADMHRLKAKEHKFKEMDLPEEPKIKAVISGDSPEEILEGAKELPKAMSMAEKFMEARLGSDSDKKDKKKKK